ncbi:MAG: SsrA-binding protein [Azospirillum brasilense]|nr:MAG: SsrA-binding protein [Azospirillum brasilense]
MSKQPDNERYKKVAINRRAHFEYAIQEQMEAGIQLLGTEVKSLRSGRANIQDAYASHKEGEIWLWNAHIPEYSHGNRQNHEPTRGRKLLLSKRQVQKLIGALKVRGVTLIPLSVYFNDRGWAKIQLAVAAGKKKHEKREAIKERDWKREQGRLLKK